ncbi:NAD(P)H-quinone oxidoreductase [Rhodococcus rhodnii]|uniref:NAD(P)H-quinone oxidoreductase n=2 Tax=Rhodococcus rhodnii TaxID=38312 RepID=A0A6P2CCN8_9NOCA|nr:NAD(P)H-quinone oxidoreductase [Rhodococcus rhodnii]TXG89461.1 NAD(P)H-quinone oxidoreductase [Rhodococcus rhodnii]
MRAITISEPGGPEVMVWGEAPEPELLPGHVLIDVRATAVNRADLLQRQGKYPPPPGASEVLGLECSGTIAALGEGVSGWSIGDEVCALLAGGGYAERVVVPAQQVLPVPAGVDLAAAAGLPEVACTVWSNVVMRGRVTTGEVFLVHGGGSGIGTHAIQLAKALGATVATTAGSPGKLERCRELGADITIDYTNEDFVEVLRDLTDGHGADVILDNMGAKYLPRNVDVLAKDGRLAIIGMQGGVTGELNIGALLGKRATVTAAGLRGRPVSGAHSKGEIVDEVRRHVWPLVEAGRVVPVVSAELPIADAPRGHELLDSPDNVGKVILTIDD